MTNCKISIRLSTTYLEKEGNESRFFNRLSFHRDFIEPLSYMPRYECLSTIQFYTKENSIQILR